VTTVASSSGVPKLHLQAVVGDDNTRYCRLVVMAVAAADVERWP
jgi:hypothetical protein